MTVMQQWLPAQANPEVVVNENFGSLEHMAVYAKNPATTTGLTWGYLGGRWGGFAVTSGTLALTASATNYVVVAKSTGVISVSTLDANWDDTATYARVYKLTVGASGVTAAEDHRAGTSGIFAGSGAAYASGVTESSGAFTPTIIGSTTAGVGTYNVQSGYYVKTGKTVSIFISLNWTAHTGAGNLRLAGLPFPIATGAGALMEAQAVNLAWTGALQAKGFSGGSVLYLQGSASGQTSPTEIPFDTSAGLTLAGTYMTA